MKQLLSSFVLFCISHAAMGQSVSIGTSTPHPSAVLELKGTSKGFLPPRMTDLERFITPSPAEGLMVYDSVNRDLYVFKGMGGWTPLRFTLPYSGTDGSPISMDLRNTNAGGTNYAFRGILGNPGGTLPAPAAIYGFTDRSGAAGILGEGSNATGIGVWGKGTITGVRAESAAGDAVYASGASNGVYGFGINRGLYGESSSGTGVFGFSTSGNAIMSNSAAGNSLYSYKTLTQGGRTALFENQNSGNPFPAVEISTPPSNVGLKSTGFTQLTSLGGSGTQMVITDNNGYLGKQSIPVPFSLPYAGADNNAISFQITNTNSPLGNKISIYGVQGGYGSPGLGVPASVYGGTDINGGNGVVGDAAGNNGIGVYGRGISNGVFGFSQTGMGAEGRSGSGYGVYGVSTNSIGIFGQSDAAAPNGTGVRGHANGNGVWGSSAAGNGILGEASGTAIGVRAISQSGFALSATSYLSSGIYGESLLGTNGIGIRGNGTGAGVHGISGSSTGVGVLGQNNSIIGKTIGIKGIAVSANDTTAGVWGEADPGPLVTNTKAYGVAGVSKSGIGAGVIGFSTNNSGGIGVMGISDLNTGVYGYSDQGLSGVWGTGNFRGVSGTIGSDGGTGVYGDGGFRNNAFGVQGIAAGNNSIAVQAVASSTARYALNALHANGTTARFATNSSGATEQLLIEETENDFARIKFKNTNAPFWVIGPYSSATGASANARFNIFYSNLNNGAGADAFVMDGNGNLTIAGNAFKPGGGAWNVPSDARLKKNITDFTDGLNVINQIHPVNFQYNGLLNLPADKIYTGVLAQELQSAAPYMVQQIRDSKEGYLQVDPNALSYLLINAVKELDKENKELKKEIQQIREKLVLR